MKMLILVLIMFMFCYSQDISSPVGWWTLSESDLTGADMSDKSGNGHTGTIYGNPTYTLDPWGRATGAMEFDGDGDYIDCGDLAHDGEAAYSISAWVKYDTTSVYFQYIYGVSDPVGAGPPPGRYCFSVTYDDGINGNKLYVAGATSFWSETNTSGGITDTWYHLVMTWSSAADDIKAYRNGALIATTVVLNGAGNLRTDNGIFIIARDEGDAGPPPGRDFAGAICQVRAYNKELTPADVLELYNYTPGNKNNQNRFPIFPEGPLSIEN